MRHAWLIALILPLCLAAGIASAGAWPRERGTGFATASVRLSWPQDIALRRVDTPAQQYNTIYLEYGLTDRLTLGLDLGRSVSGANKTMVFLQMPLRHGKDGPKLTWQLGFGKIAGDTVVRPGLALGWGRENGWFSVEALAEVSVDDGQTDIKVDVTWGRNLARDRKLILQMQMGDPATDPPFARFAPSMVFSLRDSLKFEAGASIGLAGDDSVGLKIGLWKSF